MPCYNWHHLNLDANFLMSACDLQPLLCEVVLQRGVPNRPSGKNKGSSDTLH